MKKKYYKIVPSYICNDHFYLTGKQLLSFSKQLLSPSSENQKKKKQQKNGSIHTVYIQYLPVIDENIFIVCTQMNLEAKKLQLYYKPPGNFFVKSDKVSSE